MDNQKAQIENRIIKLQKEEEKAAKRIRDLQRQQRFRIDQNEEKTRRLNEMANHRAFMKDTEENNRRKFNQDRMNSQSRIQQSMERSFYSNRSAYNDVKSQQARINDLVHSNNMNFLRDRQKQFQKIKDTQTRAKSHFNTVSAMNVQNLKSGYDYRVQEKKDIARMTEDYNKKLEIEEAQLLNRLQKTYQTERHMTDMLNKVSDASPIK